MLTPESRIEDLDKLLTAHGLMMSATATGGLWTVSLDSRGNLSHYVGSGGSLYEALTRAFDKITREAFVAAREEGRKVVRPGKR